MAGLVPAISTCLTATAGKLLIGVAQAEFNMFRVAQNA
jgi:hypothetical protein